MFWWVRRNDLYTPPLANNGSGVLSGKMLLVRIIENNKIDAFFRAGKVK